jgi:dipeptidyl aminopeptidase
MTMDHIFNGTFSPITKRIDWVKEGEWPTFMYEIQRLTGIAPDGTYSHVDEKGNIVLNTPQSPENGTILVDSERVHGPEGQRLNWETWSLSADMEYVLFKTDHVKQWRHSSFGNYWIHRRSDLITFPLRQPKNIPTISHVTWAPVGHSLAFVDHNDLYVIDGEQLRGDDPEVIRVTDDGSPVIFNGVPDWVYEEEVFSSDSALWWSPDGNTVAYLRFDEEKVPDYKLQYYNPGNDAFEIHQFPTEVDMK